MTSATHELPADVAAYLATVPDVMREALVHLRGLVIAAAPEAVEGISYGIPGFKYRGRPLVGYGAAKNHCAFYVQSPALMDAIREDLTAFDTAKGTIRFPADKPLPEQLVTKLVQARIAETDAAEAARRQKARDRRKPNA